MKITVHSNIGKRRATNQDYADYFVNGHGQHLFVLCDGVGGHQAGDVASKETCEFVGEQFKRLNEALTLETVNQWYENVIQAVNRVIYQRSVEHRELAGMGTTLVMALVIDDCIKIAHVGDSRAYSYHAGTLKQLTQDHSLINELIKRGKITHEEGLVHPHRNVVTRSIGGVMEVEAELTEVPVEEVDILMLCSDGLTNMVSHEQLLNYLDSFASDDSLRALGEQLVVAANDAGGIDNISIILVSEWHSPEGEVLA
ncbi:Stp1/IreP family PP2C-type Ser/Thr phosphatase [Aerococcaceae bacterium NML190073]|nr:Stp1/IreP family PP2C-type Ser/Thr phosphatase [Aerococcaceae bacterium NML190073]